MTLTFAEVHHCSLAESRQGLVGALHRDVSATGHSVCSRAFSEIFDLINIRVLPFLVKVKVG
jgi:hypothetical protein